ncbi:exopolysaccharide biosynthesis polyprenyl glycosylphosphotransferase [Lichenihabitans sp. Uapishka_5]|uniref:exopolysaccharide biosynthesis polyprenyl glycosylphosphotransferase n=1 Tax=Lichenihabitans sp. Uapishka_5 TaxID=3037302 RepID=UPI0029E7CC84|nr:exopolysaccharide biosynthesis polyprenyl glycosylphosphotransferase [Lichenihabitans sp. Uapishka_5]MDX7951503.1 exopolysaccharide biosynthesis polyprenyl glycosylphosphotransferase [Lichenihabitans sp. Uapishka_5]
MSQRSIALGANDKSEVSDWPTGLQLSYRSLGVLVSLTEMIGIILCSIGGEAIFDGMSGRPAMTMDVTMGIGTVASLIYVALGKARGLYRFQALYKPSRYFNQVFTTCGVVVLGVTGALFLLKAGQDMSRGTWLCFGPLMVASCYGIRLGAGNIVTSLLRRDAVIGRRAFLLGETEELARVTPNYLLQQFGLREVGRASLDKGNPGTVGLDDARMADALEQARASKAKEFIVVAKWDSNERLNAIEECFRVSPLPVRLLPNHVFRSVVHRHGPHESCAVHLIDLQRSPMSLGELVAKRALDVLGAGFAIMLLLPVFLITAAAIKFDSVGPIIFRQRRNGFNQDQFVIYKFRTMTVMEDDEKVVQARRGDKRVTRVGSFLRRSSVDELPQLFNVLKGDMSMVGPRPHALAHDREYGVLIGDYYRRHHVKPGITGWAQVHGFRGETAHTDQMRRRIDLDVWYINNWSLLTDIRILVRTFFTVMKHDAY